MILKVKIKQNLVQIQALLHQTQVKILNQEQITLRPVLMDKQAEINKAQVKILILINKVRLPTINNLQRQIIHLTNLVLINNHNQIIKNLELLIMIKKSQRLVKYP